MFITFLLNVLYFPRLDLSPMPGPDGTLYRLDSGFSSYM
jgi:hypothetical protein